MQCTHTKESSTWQRRARLEQQREHPCSRVKHTEPARSSRSTDADTAPRTAIRRPDHTPETDRSDRAGTTSTLNGRWLAKRLGRGKEKPIPSNARSGLQYFLTHKKTGLGDGVGVVVVVVVLAGAAGCLHNCVVVQLAGCGSNPLHGEGIRARGLTDGIRVVWVGGGGWVWCGGSGGRSPGLALRAGIRSRMRWIRGRERFHIMKPSCNRLDF